MRIIHDRKSHRLWLSQERYLEKVLERFNMSKARPVYSPLAGHFRLSSLQYPKSEVDKDEMKKIPYAFAIGNLMYSIVCTILDIAHDVGVVIYYLSNLSKEHWRAVK